MPTSRFDQRLLAHVTVEVKASSFSQLATVMTAELDSLEQLEAQRRARKIRRRGESSRLLPLQTFCASPLWWCMLHYLISLLLPDPHPSCPICVSDLPPCTVQFAEARGYDHGDIQWTSHKNQRFRCHSCKKTYSRMEVLLQHFRDSRRHRYCFCCTYAALISLPHGHDMLHLRWGFCCSLVSLAVLCRWTHCILPTRPQLDLQLHVSHYSLSHTA